MGWSHKPFEIPKNILSAWRSIGKRGEKTEKKWFEIYKKNKSKINNSLKNNFKSSIIEEKKNAVNEKKSFASRKSSEALIYSLFNKKNTLIGGSADLAGSNNTKTKNHKIIKPGNFDGNYIHYGVREHAMCGIMNGIALHSKLIPYGGTFLIFSDYCKPSIRLAAMMGQQVIYVMTHDSIGLGEDGPTHQPIEQLSGLRAIPNLNVFRPADKLETIECWELALKNFNTPSILSLTRQNLDPIRNKFTITNKCSLGAYEVLRTNKKIILTILASGSEVKLAIETSHKLAKEKIYSKVVSVPCMELFDKQSKKYRDNVLNETKFKISIEAGSSDCWRKYVGEFGITFGINEFGKSAPFKEIFNYFGLVNKNIAKKSKNLIKR